MPIPGKKGGGTDLSQAAERLSIPLWGRLLIGGLATCLVAACGGLWWVYSRIDGHLVKMDDQLGKLRESVRVLETQQPKAIQDTINAILQQIASAAKSGNLDEAEKAAIVATALINVEKANKAEADAKFFEESLAELRKVTAQAPKLQHRVFDVKLSLAQYRSSLNPVPPVPTETGKLPWTNITVQPPRITEHKFIGVQRAAYPVLTTINLNPPKPITIEGNGAALDASGMRPDQELIIVATRSLDQNPAVIKDLIFIGANQRLDYITWENVTFVGTHIKYDGGPVRLHNVRFVNCTFALPRSDAGSQMAEYVALEPKNIVTVG